MRLLIEIDSSDVDALSKIAWKIKKLIEKMDQSAEVKICVKLPDLIFFDKEDIEAENQATT